jgi:hypothetical protein
MASVNSVKIVLWLIGLVPLLGAVAISILVGSIAYLRVKTRAKREMKSQNLKTKVDALKEQLSSIQTMAAMAPIKLSGAGPFQLPHLTQIGWLVSTHEDRIMAEFISQDGNRICAGMTYRAVAQLLNDHHSGPLQKKALSPVTSIDLAKAFDAYELPVLPRLEGHFDRGRELRILVFSYEDGRRILLPVFFPAYEELLIQSKAALVSYLEENRVHEITPRQRSVSSLFMGR